MGGRRVRFELPMSQYTTFRVGGKGETAYFPEDEEELRGVLAYLTSERIPYLVVGKGSNILVRDGGIPGVVIMLRGALAGIQRDDKEPDILLAGGGATISELLRFCAREGLTGAEFLAGIPGTVGGAVAMNAGAWGKDTGSMVQAVRIVTPHGGMTTLARSGLGFTYRGSSLPAGAVIACAGLQLQGEDKEMVSRRIEDYLKRRKASQPLESASAGSVFKNPRNDYAGRLIERAGFKGTKVGGAMISTKHANFIVNTGGATAKDILCLMALARQGVREETGIDLEPEIRVIGIE